MSEPTWTTMHIGGTLPANKIAELVEAIIGDFHEIAEGPNTTDDDRFVSDIAKSGEKLLVQGQVNYGNPGAVTAFCRTNGLTYWLHFDAGPEWDSGIEIWKPGADCVEQIGASAQGYTPMVDLSTLRIWAKPNLTLQHVIDDVSRFESDKVPPFTIGEAVADEPKEATNG